MIVKEKLLSKKMMPAEACIIENYQLKKTIEELKYEIAQKDMELLQIKAQKIDPSEVESQVEQLQKRIDSLNERVKEFEKSSKSKKLKASCRNLQQFYESMSSQLDSFNE